MCHPAVEDGTREAWQSGSTNAVWLRYPLSSNGMSRGAGTPHGDAVGEVDRSGPNSENSVSCSGSAGSQVRRARPRFTVVKARER
jgi:hypothetical protein